MILLYNCYEIGNESNDLHLQFAKHKTQNTRHKAQGTKHKAQNTKHKTQSTIQDCELNESIKQKSVIHSALQIVH